MAIEKIKILGAVLELPAKQHCQSSPFTSKIGLNWQCCSAGSSKTAPKILIFSIAMGADYLFGVKNIEIWAPAFFKHNNSSVATVPRFTAASLVEEQSRVRCMVQRAGHQLFIKRQLGRSIETSSPLKLSKVLAHTMKKFDIKSWKLENLVKSLQKQNNHILSVQ